MNSILRSARRALLAPVLLLAAAACGDESDPVVPEITSDIIDIATTTPDVSTLAAAIEAAGLVDALRGSGPFTVFAPVNAAFAELGDAEASLPEGEIDDGPRFQELARMGRFHGVMTAARLLDLGQVAGIEAARELFNS